VIPVLSLSFKNENGLIVAEIVYSNGTSGALSIAPRSGREMGK
jgi:hypothetical protein